MSAEKKRKANVAEILLIMVVAIALGTSVFLLLSGKISGNRESGKVTDKELKVAMDRGSGYGEEETDGDIEVIAVSRDITIVAGGNPETKGQAEETETVEDTETVPDDGSEYIFPDSDTEYLTDSDVSGMSKEELRIARNEIFARHGRIFDSQDLKDYFNGKSWYNGTIPGDEFDANMDSRLNKVERANVEMIKKYE